MPSTKQTKMGVMVGKIIVPKGRREKAGADPRGNRAQRRMAAMEDMRAARRRRKARAVGVAR